MTLDSQSRTKIPRSSPRAEKNTVHEDQTEQSHHNSAPSTTGSHMSPTSPCQSSPLSVEIESSSSRSPLIFSPTPRSQSNSYFSVKNNVGKDTSNRPQGHSRPTSPLARHNMSSEISKTSPRQQIKSEEGPSPLSQSLTSSGFLTPPISPADDTEKPPYKPSNENSESLNMMHTRTSKTSNRRRHRWPRECHHKHWVRSQEPWNGNTWNSPACQVAPTAPVDHRTLCEGQWAELMQWAADESTSKAYRKGLVRRWSSVEMGTHQIRRASYELVKSGFSVSGAKRSQTRLTSSTTASRLSSSKGVRDVIHSVCEKLKSRPLLPAFLRAPTSIILRRASRSSAGSTASSTRTIESPSETIASENTPRIIQSDLAKRRESAFLITSEDISSIAEIIEKNLKQNSFAQVNGVSAPHSGSVQIFHPAKLPSFSQNGLMPCNGSPAESTLTVAEVQVSCLNPLDDPKYLDMRANSFGKRGSHEVIWKADGTPLSFKPDDSDNTENSSSDSSDIFQLVLGRDKMSTVPDQVRTVPTKSSSIGSTTSVADTIEDWCWEQQTSIAVPRRCFNYNSSSIDIDPSQMPTRSAGQSVSTLSPDSSNSKIVTPLQSSSPNNVSTKVTDVVSFPPLPRKTTSEWHSPVPDINLPVLKMPQIAEPTAHRRSLYDIGIDATPSSRDGLGTRKMEAHIPELVEDIDSPYDSASPIQAVETDRSEDNPMVDSLQSTGMHRKPSIRPHPGARPRLGSQVSLGSAIGCSGKQKRRHASFHSLHVLCVDNSHRSSSSATSTWNQARAPSVCPCPAHSTSTSVESSTGSRATASRQNSGDTRCHSIGSEQDCSVDRCSSMTVKSSLNIHSEQARNARSDVRSISQHKTEPVGIYGKLTGARRESDSGDFLEATLDQGACDCSDEVSVDWIG